MSFPRAKLQRFNELHVGCAPPPGHYDPLLGNKVKGILPMDKNEKSADTKSSAKTNEEMCPSKGTSYSLPVFRTPQQPVRKPSKIPTGKSKARTKLEIVSDSDSKNNSPENGILGFGDSACNLQLLQKKLDDTLSELEKYRSYCLKMEASIADNKSQIENLEELKSNLEEQLKQVQADLADVTLKLKDNSKDQISNIAKLEEYSTLLKSSCTEIEQLKVELTAKLEYIGKLDAEKSLLTESMKENVIASETEKQKLNDEISVIREELLEQTNLSSDLEHKLSQKQHVILMLQSQLSTAEVELEECKAEYERALSEFEAEKSTLTSSYEKEIEVLEANIENLSEQMDSEERAHSLKLNSLKKELHDASDEIKGLRENLNMKTSSISCLRNQLHLVESSLNDMYKELEQTKKREEIVIKTVPLIVLKCIDDAESTVFKCFNEASEKLNAIEEKYHVVMNKFLTTSKKKIIDLQEYSNSHIQDMKIQLEEEINNVDVRIELVNSVIEKLSRHLDILDDESIKKLEFLETQLLCFHVEKQKEISLLNAKIIDLEEINRALVSERDDLRVANVDYQLTTVELQNKIDELAAKYSSVQDKLSNVLTELETTEDQRRKFEVGNRNLHDTLEALRDRLLESEKYVEELSDNNKCLTCENTNLKESLNLQEQRLENMVAANLKQVADVKEELLHKLELFKIQAQEEVKKKNDDIYEQNQLIQELMSKFNNAVLNFQKVSEDLNFRIEENETQRKKISEINLELEDSRLRFSLLEDALTSLNSDYQCAVIQLKACKTELENAKELRSQNDYMAEYNKLCDQYEVLKERNLHLEDSLSLLKEKIGCYEEGDKILIPAEFSYEESPSDMSLSFKSEVSQEESHKSTTRNCKADGLATASRQSILEMALVEKDGHIQTLIDENERLVKQIEDVKGKIGSQEENYLSAAVELQKQQSVLQDAENVINDKQLEVDLLKKKCYELHQDILQLKNLLQTKDVEYLSTRTILEEELKNNEQDMLNLKHQNTKMIEENENLKSTLSLLQDKEAKLDVCVQENEKLKSELEHLKTCQIENMQLKQKCTELEALVGPFKEQLTAYKDEQHHLTLSLQGAENKISELFSRHAEILGHTNQKQKIKYMLNLKDEIITLREQVDKLQAEKRCMARTIAKLKDEMLSVNKYRSTIRTKGKEKADQGCRSKGKENSDPIPVVESQATSLKVLRPQNSH